MPVSPDPCDPRFYAPDVAQQAAADDVLRRAIALIYRPLSWRERREADRQAAAVRGLLQYEARRGVR